MKLETKYDLGQEVYLKNRVKEYHERVKDALIAKGFYPAIVKSVLEDVEKEMAGK